MKARMGFVSNSSSSSFCLLGIRTEIEPREDEQPWDIPERYSKETGLDCFPTDECYEEFYVGKALMEGYGGVDEMSIETFETKLLEAKYKLAEKGITNYKVFTGEVTTG